MSFKKLIIRLCIVILLPAYSFAQSTEKAILAGGCFWCIEAAMDQVSGVSETISGYTGGHTKNPSYKAVTQGNTGHYEAVLVIYDPQKVTFTELLEVFWRNIDPFDEGGQFADRGDQYKTAIFYLNHGQREIAEKSKTATEKKLGQQITTQILPQAPFYRAEEYHQDYYRKNFLHYNRYKYGSGRPQRLEEVWGDE